MGKECIVVGCCNRDTDKSVDLKFHRIPKAEPRRSMWLQAIRRRDSFTGRDWCPGDETARVCSEHFIEGKSDDPNHPDYVPTQRMGYYSESKCTLSTERYDRSIRRTSEKKRRHMTGVDEMARHHDAAQALIDLSEQATYEPPTPELDVANNDKTTHDTCVKRLAESNIEQKRLCRELERLQLENSKLKETRTFMRADQLGKSKPDETTLFYTGLPSYKCFLWLVTFVSTVLPMSSILEPSDILLLLLMKLRLNAPHRDISHRFGISLSLVSNLLNAGIPKLASKLTFFVRWPSKDDIYRCQPQCFKETFPKCVSIIDCTEVFIECPSNFTARSTTYSNYKHTNTIKFLVSIVPCGTISFISRAFGGRTSDKVITYRSGYLDFIVHGDVVMADRGFLIRDELASRGAELVIPAFVRGKSQLSAREVEFSRKLSSVRIHVERVMERLKNFRILAGRMSLNMVPHSDSIMTICAAISNMHPNLVN